jgi:predicted lipid-binding transport protein (Tim44 family)
VQTSVFQNGSGFGIGLVLFGAIALFLVLRLRSVLGKRVGFEKPPLAPGQMPGFGAGPAAGGPTAGGPIIDGQASQARTGRPVPDPHSALGERLMRIVNADANFDPPKFLDGAETAFRAIVTAFAAGDRASLKNLLSDNVYQTFDSAITSREAAGERHRTEIKSILSAVIEDAELLGPQAAVIVRFTSDQVNLTLDAAGNPATGTEAVTELVDLWTFEHVVGSKDPTWRLAAARSG